MTQKQWNLWFGLSWVWFLIMLITSNCPPHKTTIFEDILLIAWLANIITCVLIDCEPEKEVDEFGYRENDEVTIEELEQYEP